ncbi:hypothetical protein Tco_1102332 [Tanacetum coccineum]
MEEEGGIAKSILTVFRPGEAGSFVGAQRLQQALLGLSHLLNGMVVSHPVDGFLVGDSQSLLDNQNLRPTIRDHLHWVTLVGNKTACADVCKGCKESLNPILRNAYIIPIVCPLSCICTAMACLHVCMTILPLPIENNSPLI